MKRIATLAVGVLTTTAALAATAVPASADSYRPGNGTSKSSMQLQAPYWHSDLDAPAWGTAQTVETRSKNARRHSLSVKGHGLQPSACFVVLADVLDGYDGDGYDYDREALGTVWSDELGSIALDGKVSYTGPAPVYAVVDEVQVRTCSDDVDGGKLVLASDWDD